jgi:hypothetical protein
MNESDLAQYFHQLVEHSEWLVSVFGLSMLVVWIKRRRGRFWQSAPASTAGKPSTVKSLFWELDCYLDSEEDSQPHKVFLRSLTPHKATMITTDAALRKGVSFRLDLGPLTSDTSVETPQIGARVIRSKNLGGSPSNFLLSVQFMAEQGAGSPTILRYLSESVDRVTHKPSNQLEVL